MKKRNEAEEKNVAEKGKNERERAVRDDGERACLHIRQHDLRLGYVEMRGNATCLQRVDYMVLTWKLNCPSIPCQRR